MRGFIAAFDDLNDVAGVLGGDGYGSVDTYPGVAPGAAIYSLRVLDEEGKGLTSDVIAALFQAHERFPLPDFEKIALSYNTVPEKEIRGRISRFQSLLRREDIHAAIILQLIDRFISPGLFKKESWSFPP